MSENLRFGNKFGKKKKERKKKKEKKIKHCHC